MYSDSHDVHKVIRGVSFMVPMAKINIGYSRARPSVDRCCMLRVPYMLPCMSRLSLLLVVFLTSGTDYGHVHGHPPAGESGKQKGGGKAISLLRFTTYFI